MSPAMIPVAAWAVLVAWRLWLAPKRWSLPMLRGANWFFGTEVGLDFYAGEGRELLRRYRMSIVMPFAVELLAAVAIIADGRYVLLIWLIMVGTVVSALVQTVVAKRMDRRVRAAYSAGAPPAVSKLAVSLEHRTLASYTRLDVELGIAGVTLAAFALCTVQAMKWHSFRAAFLAPLIALYLQLGVLLVKDTVVRMRRRVPADDAESYARFSEEVTRYWAAICDGIRVLITCALFSTSVVAPLYERWGMTGRWVAMSPLIVGLFVYLIRARGRILHITGASREVRPVDFSKLPAHRPDKARFALGGLFYFDASNPRLSVRGPAGYTLNFANRRLWAFAGYAAGFAAIAILGA